MKPRRSILSVPGHVLKMHHKAAASAADVVMLDLEDSVPLEAKSGARQQVIRSLQQSSWTSKTVTVRINGLDTAFGYRDLLEVAEAAGDLLTGIVIPKVEHPRDIHFAARLLDGIELQRGRERPLGLEAAIETAAGLQQVAAIADASDRVQTLVFGIADYSASIGARLVSLSGHGEKEETLYPGHRWHFALSRMVMAGKARGLMVIDAPYGNFKDVEGLERSAVMACALGCDGKWAIHPGQVDTLNRVFSPSQEDIERAGRVLEAFQQAQAQGRGAIAVDGRMVDQATVRMARQLWEQARQLGLV
ncbi:MAG: CoA ester lyase [Desulfobacterales bacterium]